MAGSGHHVYACAIDMREFLTSSISALSLWILAGFLIGLGLGVNSISVWLVAAGLGLFLVYLGVRGGARWPTETLLFWSGPGYMMAWVLGFVVHGIAL